MEKPWFKFTATNWLSGSVQLLSDSEKGTYIDLIAMIWKEGGKLDNNKILSRKLRLDYATACDRINSYCELGILQCENGILSIKFIDEQIDLIKDRSEKARENAEKRWSKKDRSMQPHANKKRKEEIREDKKRVDKNIKEKEAFDIFRKSYPGTKKGLETEFQNFTKKHKDWKEVVFDLKAILDCQKNQRDTLAKSEQFVPPWKNLQTWINQRCWEEEMPVSESTGQIPRYF